MSRNKKRTASATILLISGNSLLYESHEAVSWNVSGPLYSTGALIENLKVTVDPELREYGRLGEIDCTIATDLFGSHLC